MDKHLKRAAKYIKKLNLAKFIIMARQDPELGVHVENMTIGEVIETMSMGFRHAISMYMNMPERTEEEKKLAKELDEKFISVIEENNKKYFALVGKQAAKK